MGKDYVTRHSFWHSRKTASPQALAKLDPDRYPFSRHKLVQLHKPSDRMNLYIPSHIRSIEGLSEQESKEKLAFLRKHVMKEKYALSIEWLNVGDLVVWDNTCTLHRATTLKAGFRRDMRRCGVSLAAMIHCLRPCPRQAIQACADISNPDLRWRPRRLWAQPP